MGKGNDRVVIEGVSPQVDGGRFPIKRTIGEEVVVEADVFADGTNEVACWLLHRQAVSDAWLETPMEPIGNDRFRGSFTPSELGDHRYTVRARIVDPSVPAPDSAHYDRELPLVVDRTRARVGAWYEMFPRSASPEPGGHGTFADVEARLPYVAGMGFGVLYLPPIHPIGWTNRKGRNGAELGAPGDPGSPWAIGSEEGGHRSVHGQLGTLADFDRVVSSAGRHGLEIAMDLAFHCSPDHPWVKKHPEWFRVLPDGRVHHAENPPKRYEDIYPLDFDTEDRDALWEELRDVALFWIDRGVRIFRADNPHTKPFAFWEWLIADVRRRHPDVIFLSEAFTRPKVMRRLAKLGFSQSYTYFAWRTTARELTDYFEELARPDVRDYFRPNLWANTPDILIEQLQTGGRPGFVARLVLAATLGESYGIYGPPFELMEREPLRPGSEEYLNSEKYEIRHWDVERPDSLRDLITAVNRLRRDHPALLDCAGLRFHATGNEHVIAYSKAASDDAVLVAVNLDPHRGQTGEVSLPADRLPIEDGRRWEAADALTGARVEARGRRLPIDLAPDDPARIIPLPGGGP